MNIPQVINPRSGGADTSRVRGLSRRDRRPSTALDGGFAMVEMMVSLVIIAIVTTAALAFFINGLRSESGQRQRQEAIYLADQQMQAAQALAPVDLVKGNTQAEQVAALSTPIASTLNLAAESDPAATASFDSNASDSPVIQSPMTQPVNNISYKIWTFAVACHYDPTSGNCGQTATTGSATELRVTVAVTWTSNANCTAGCNYSTSTFVDPNSDATFNTNISTPSGSITTPSTSSFYNDNTATRASVPAETCTTGPAGNTVTVPGTEMIITGAGLKSNVRVWIASGGGSIPTNTVYQPSATEIDACLQTGDVPGTYTISVINTDGGHFQTTVTEKPTIRWAALSGSGSSRVLTLNGGGFVNGATMTETGGGGGTFNWVSPTQATLTSYVDPTAGTAVAPVLTLTEPPPGSQQATFTLPDMSASTSPASVAVGTSVAVSVTGTGLESGLTTTGVTNGTATASYTSATSATVVVRASTVGTTSFALLNPDGGVSNTITLTVDPLPTISPAPTPKLTSTAFALNGTGFMPGISVGISGGDLVSASYVSATQLSLTVTGTAYGTFTLTLLNPDGGIVTTPITINPRPVVTSDTPAVTGQVATTVTGTGFQSNITASVTNGTVNSVTWISATQIRVLLTATPGTQTLTLTNPTDGGTTTASVLVDNPPVATSTTTAVSGQVATTITGTGFQSNISAAVTNGSVTSVTYVSSTQIKVYLTATAGTQTITLTNPSDGGSTTKPVTVDAAPNMTSETLSPTQPTHNTTVTVTVNGTGFTTSSSYTASWTKGGSTTTATPIITSRTTTKGVFTITAPATAGTYTLTLGVGNPDGGTDNDTLTVTVK